MLGCAMHKLVVSFVNQTLSSNFKQYKIQFTIRGVGAVYVAQSGSKGVVAQPPSCATTVVTTKTSRKHETCMK